MDFAGKYWKLGTLTLVDQALDALERQISALRQAAREAAARRDHVRVRELRAELRRAERAWDTLLSPPDDADAGYGSGGPSPHLYESGSAAATPARDRRTTGPTSIVPAREQVHRALTLLGVPAAPKLIGTVHEAFFSGPLPASRLASLRRDEERSYRSSPGARPYYLCPALTYDRLVPARALLTISTWPLEDRVVGPLSPRVHFLTAAINIADAVARLRGAAASGDADPAAAQEASPGWSPGRSAERLLRRFADNVPGAVPDPAVVRAAARAELEIHAAADRKTRLTAARRAREQLGDAEQLFGARLAGVGGAATGTAGKGAERGAGRGSVRRR